MSTDKHKIKQHKDNNKLGQYYTTSPFKRYNIKNKSLQMLT